MTAHGRKRSEDTGELPTGAAIFYENNPETAQAEGSLRLQRGSLGGLEEKAKGFRLSAA